jgi:Trk K+ transport system NAD-binding subunit
MNQQQPDNSFLVCGLGSLGQHCVTVLQEFGVTVYAIDQAVQPHWRMAEAIDQVIIGDCRQPQVLEQANIRRCRAILLVTSDEKVNVEAAFAARSLNPKIRLVVRSAQDNLNEILTERLGNFIALEPIQLPAPSFAIAALGGQTRGFFSLDNQLLKVVRVTIDPTHNWCDSRQLYELNTSTRRLLSHFQGVGTPLKAAFQWDPQARVQAGDIITYIQVSTPKVDMMKQPRSHWRQRLFATLQQISTRLNPLALRQQAHTFWQEGSQTQRVASVSAVIILTLYSGGVLFYLLLPEKLSLGDALNVALVLILGGYDNLFGGGLKLSFNVPWWLQLFSVLMTIAGTIFIGIFYAMLTERLLAARFQFSKRRPPVPKADHVVLVGLGRVGQGVVALLQELKQPIVGVHATALDANVLAQTPLVIGNLKQALTKVNLATAKSVIAVTDDEIINLEIGLRANAANPQINLVIRTFEQGFGQQVAQLLPTARVLSAYALSAEAFAAAAFGENILNLFRLHEQTMLVTEYRIDVADTLRGKLLADVAYGYGVVPILHQREQAPPKMMPTDDLRLEVGDRLVVLASIAALQRVESGTIKPQQWELQVEKATTPAAQLEGAMAIARISGCEIGLAHDLMNQLPGVFSQPLYRHQVQRLVRELSKLQVRATACKRGE